MPVIRLAHRLRSIVSLFSTITTIVILLRHKPLHNTLQTLFSPREHPLRLTALLTTLALNSKSLPLIWHFRLFGSMLYQLYLQPTALPKDALFRPIITRNCYTTLLETDYNLHKSNSTYFADLDIGRTALISALLRKGILETQSGRRARARAAEEFRERAQAQLQAGIDPSATMPTLESTAASKDMFVIALGGVSATFRRELKPYEPFDMWTRVLAWDRKWVYIVQHMVKAGTVPPGDMDAAGCWALQPWKESEGRTVGWFSRLFGRAGRAKDAAKAAKKAGGANAAPSIQVNGDVSARGSGSGNTSSDDDDSDEAAQRKAWQSAIFATSISKYVIKRGRLTIPAEEVLFHNDLLPPPPPNYSSSSSSSVQYLPDDGEAETDNAESPSEWNWQNVQREKLRGLKIAEKFGALDELMAEFPASLSAPYEGSAEAQNRVRVLGSYPDFLW